MNVTLDLTRILTVVLVLMLGAGGGWLIRLRMGNRRVKGMDVDLFERVQEIATAQLNDQKQWMREQVETVRRECEERLTAMHRELHSARTDQQRTQRTLTHTQRRVIAYELRVFQLQNAMQRADPPIPIPPWPDEPADEIPAPNDYRT